MKTRVFVWGGAFLLACGLGVWMLAIRGPAVGVPGRHAEPLDSGLAASKADADGVFQPRPCWVRLGDTAAECGIVSVPASASSAPSAAGARRVKLAVLRVPSRRPSGQPPLVFLGGGPGEPVIGRLASSLKPLLTLADDRELVFVDPRGTGFSAPKLLCREKRNLPEALRSCFEEHSVEQDLGDFTTAAGVRDLLAVQRALGHGPWDVLATSYGTRLALTLLREAPEHVRALVLDSPVPLEVDLIGRLGNNAHRALASVLAACSAQLECARAFPNLEPLTYALLEDLRGKPRVSPAGTVDLESFVRVLLALLYSEEATTYVPQLLFRAVRGDFDLFWKLAQGLGADDFSLGVHLSVQCAEEVPFTSPERVARADEAVPPGLRDILSGKTYLDDCRHWPVPEAGPLENVPVRGAARALVFSGDLDPVTPPEYAQQVFEALDGSRLLRVRGATHGVGRTACGLQAVRAFLEAPDEPVPLGCLAGDANTAHGAGVIAHGAGEPNAASGAEKHHLLLGAGEEMEVGRAAVFRTAPPSASELRNVLAEL